MLSLYETADAGNHWLQQRLEVHAASTRNPTMVVDMALSQTVPFSDGQSMALLASPLKGDLYSFDAGWYRDDTNFIPVMAQWIHEFTSHDASNICLIDEQNAEPHFGYWMREVAPNFSDAVLFCSNSIFYRISHANNDLFYIRDLLELTYSWFFCCALVVCDTVVRDCKPHTDLRLSDIEAAVAGVRGIAVDAYDLEGMMLWKSSYGNSNNPFPMHKLQVLPDVR